MTTKTTTQNLWDAAKAVLRRKFIPIQSYLKKQEKQNRQPHFTFKTTGRRRIKKNPKVSRRKEIIEQWKGNEIIVKINKTKSGFFEKKNKTDKLLARLIKKKREKNQVDKVRKEKGEIKTDNVEIQRIIRDYEQLYANKMDNLELMDRFLDKFNLTRLNQKETEIMNKSIIMTEIETVI